MSDEEREKDANPTARKLCSKICLAFEYFDEFCTVVPIDILLENECCKEL